MQVNSTRKANKYNKLIKELSSTYNKPNFFINLSMGALCVMGSSCDSFLLLLIDLNFDKIVQKRIIMKTINIAIRTSLSFAKEISHGTTQNFWTFNSFSYYFTLELCYMSTTIIALVICHV